MRDFELIRRTNSLALLLLEMRQWINRLHMPANPQWLPFAKALNNLFADTEMQYWRRRPCALSNTLTQFEEVLSWFTAPEFC